MSVCREFEVSAKFYRRSCAVCNIVLYCTAIYRGSIILGKRIPSIHKERWFTHNKTKHNKTCDHFWGEVYTLWLLNDSQQLWETLQNTCHLSWTSACESCLKPYFKKRYFKKQYFKHWMIFCRYIAMLCQYVLISSVQNVAGQFF